MAHRAYEGGEKNENNQYQPERNSSVKRRKPAEGKSPTAMGPAGFWGVGHRDKRLASKAMPAQNFDPPSTLRFFIDVVSDG